MEIDPTELSTPDNKLVGLYWQYVQSTNPQQRERLYQRIMDTPAHSIHGINIKAQAMLHMLKAQPVDQSEAALMLKVLAGCIGELAGTLDMAEMLPVTPIPA